MTSKQGGYTITELLVVVVVVGILSVSIPMILISNMRAIALGNNTATLISTAQLGLDTLAEQVRLGSNVRTTNRWSDPNAPGAGSGNNFSWTSDSDTLVIDSPVVDTAGDIVFLDTSQYVPETNEEVFYFQDRQIRRRIIAAPSVADNKKQTTCPNAVASSACRPDAVIMEDVESVEFTYVDVQGAEVAPENARAVQVRVTLSFDVAGGDKSTTFTTRMVFRNV